MAEEAALVTATETVVSVLVVRLVGDDAVVAILLSNMSDNLRACVRASGALGHVLVLSVLHLVDALQCLLLVAAVVTLCFLLGGIAIVLDHLHKSLALAGSGRLIVCKIKFVADSVRVSREDAKY